MRALLETLLAVARSAAEVILEVYDRPFDVGLKRAREPVTVADRRANALICTALAERFPRELIARNGEFAVMIGLLEGARAVAGVVHAPVAGMSWVGAPGTGGGASRAAASGCRSGSAQRAPTLTWIPARARSDGMRARSTRS